MIIILVFMVGVFVECMKFSVICIFCLVWLFVVYCLVVYWVWGGVEGFFGFGGDGVFDFVGGIVVYINVGVLVFVVVILFGKC